MTILLPLAVSDRNHAPSFARLMQAFGPYPDDRAIIMPTPDASHDPLLQKVIEDLRGCFSPDNVQVVVTQNSFEGGWPYGPNCHFKAAMEAANNMGWDNEPMIWMEADLMPVRHGWLQRVKDDYKMASTPFRGMLEKTRFEDTNPQTKEVTPRYPGTIHLVGAGIYPAGYVTYCTPPTEDDRKAGLSRGSPMASYRSPSYTIPFDVRCEAQHVPATQSPLWLHKPRTINWRRIEGEVFTCEDRQKDRFGLTYAGPCNLKDVCLVHGPKDESFADAILNGPPLPSAYGMSQQEHVALDKFKQSGGSPKHLDEFTQAPSQPADASEMEARFHQVISEEKQRTESLVAQIADLKEDIEQQIADNKELQENNQKLAMENAELLSQIESLSQLKGQDAKHAALPPEPAKKASKKIAKRPLATA